MIRFIDERSLVLHRREVVLAVFIGLLREGLNVLAAIWIAHLRHRSQKALCRVLRMLDDRVLEDIGVPREQIEAVVSGALESRFSQQPA